ncbi:hypothetical protein F7U66_01700 [Vibrio parahaemolyticus]|nr:hypothetical protein [Vibrio parahaemolyticus]
MSKFLRWVAVLFVSLALVACGGEGDSRNPLSDYVPGGGDNIYNKYVFIGGDGSEGGVLPEEFDSIDAIVVNDFGFSASQLPIGASIEYKVYGYRNTVQYDLTKSVSVTAGPEVSIELDSVGRLFVSGAQIGLTDVQFSFESHDDIESVGVVDAKASYLSVVYPQTRLPVGLSIEGKAYLTYTDGRVEDVTASTVWSSIDSQVVNVAGGVVSAVGPGTVEVNAQYAGEFNSTENFEVVFDPVQSIVIERVFNDDVGIGDDVAVKVVATYESGYDYDVTRFASYSVLTPAVLEMKAGSTGVVSALNSGDGRVEALYGGAVSNPLDIKVESGAGGSVNRLLEFVHVSGEFNGTRAHVGEPVSFAIAKKYSDGRSEIVNSNLAVKIDGSPEQADAKVKLGLVKTLPKQVGAFKVEVEHDGLSASQSIVASEAVPYDLVIAGLSSKMEVGQAQLPILKLRMSDGELIPLVEGVEWEIVGSALEFDQEALVAVSSGVGALVGRSTNHPDLASQEFRFEVRGTTTSELVMSPSSVRLNPSVDFELSLELKYSDGSRVPVPLEAATYEIKDISVVTFNPAEKKFQSLSVGKTQIRAEYQGKVTDYVFIDVDNGDSGGCIDCGVAPGNLTGIDVIEKKTPLGYSSSSLPVNTSLEYVVYALYDNGVREVVTNAVSVSSSSLNVSVDQFGRLFVSSPLVGAYDFDVEYLGYKETLTVNATHVVPVRMVVSGYTNGVVPVGDVSTLSPSIQYSDGSTIKILSQVSWGVDDASVLSVEGGGKVLGVSQGNARLTITDTLGRVAPIEVSFVVTEPVLKVLELTSSSVFLEQGEVAVLGVQGVFSNGTRKDVTTDVSIVIDDQKYFDNSSYEYQLVAQAVTGTASVYAELDGVVSNVETIKVIDLPYSHLELILGSGVVSMGETTSIQSVVHYTDGTVRDVTSLSAFNSSDTAIAVVSNKSVRAKLNGSVNIAASFKGLTDTKTLVVNTAALERIELRPSTITVKKAESGTLSAFAVYTDGSEFDVSPVVSWIVDFPGMADIDGGVVTGTQVGSTAVRATYSGLETPIATVNIDPLDSDSVGGVTPPDPGDVFNVHTGMSLPIKFVIKVGSGVYVDVTEDAEWSVSDGALSSIDSLGIYSANAEGSVTVTAVLKNGSGAVIASYVATVNNLPPRVTGLVMQPDFLSFDKGDNAVSTAMLLRSDGQFIVATKSPGCTASDTTLLNTLNSVGKVTLTAKRHPGSAYVSCNYLEDGETFTATIQVEVGSPQVSDIILSAASSEVGTDGFMQVSTTVKYSDGSSSNWDENLTFSVSGDAQIIGAGLLAPNSRGLVKVSAKLDGIDSNELTFEVLEPAVLSDFDCGLAWCYGIGENEELYFLGRNKEGAMGGAAPTTYHASHWVKVPGVKAKDVSALNELGIVHTTDDDLLLAGRDMSGMIFGDTQIYGFQNIGQFQGRVKEVKVYSNALGGDQTYGTYSNFTSSGYKWLVSVVTTDGELWVIGRNSGVDPFWAQDFTSWRKIADDVSMFAGAGGEQTWRTSPPFIQESNQVASHLTLKTSGELYDGLDKVGEGFVRVFASEYGPYVFAEKSDGTFYHYGTKSTDSARTPHSCAMGLVISVDCTVKQLREIKPSDFGLTNIDSITPMAGDDFMLWSDGMPYMYYGLGYTRPQLGQLYNGGFGGARETEKLLLNGDRYIQADTVLQGNMNSVGAIALIGRTPENEMFIRRGVSGSSWRMADLEHEETDDIGAPPAKQYFSNESF